MRWRNTTLWVLQWFFGVYFVVVGVMHFIVPEGLPSQMEWMYDLSDTVHIIVGIAEILGGLGLILPSVIGIRPELTVYAALGLVLIMVLAIVWHLTRGESASVVSDTIIAALLGFVAYGRWRLHPIPGRSG
jgi:uncharacterized membrane protein